MNSAVTRHRSGRKGSVLQILDSTHYKTEPAAAICPSVPLLLFSRNSSSSVIGYQMLKPQCDNRCQKLKMLENSGPCSANCFTKCECECTFALVKVISSEILSHLKKRCSEKSSPKRDASCKTVQFPNSFTSFYFNCAIEVMKVVWNLVDSSHCIQTSTMAPLVSAECV